MSGLSDRRRARVLLLGNFLSHLGLARAPIEDLAERLEAAGYEVIHASPYRNRILRPAHMLATLTFHLRSYDVAVVDVYSGPAFRIAETTAAALRMLNRPYVACLHGGGLPEFAAENETRVRKLLTGAFALTAPSPYLVDAMNPYCAATTELPNPLNLESYPFRLRDNPAPNLIWLRSLRKIYNPLLALKTLQRVRRNFPRAHLTIVGKDWGDGTAARVRAAIPELGLEGAVELRGAVEKSTVPSVLNEGDVFLNTTDFDNTPVSVLEAMACGLCVVSTNVGGLPRLIEHETDGLLVESRDPQAMAAAVERVLTDARRAASLSAAGRRKAESCGWDRIFPQWSALLDSAAAAGRLGGTLSASSNRGASS